MTSRPQEINLGNHLFKLWPYGAVVVEFKQPDDETEPLTSWAWKPLVHIGREDLEDYIFILKKALKKREQYEGMKQR